MKLDKAINTLKEFNQWRRGAYIPMPDPKVIGLAIDIVVKHHEAMQELEARVNQVDKSIEKRWDALNE